MLTKKKVKKVNLDKFVRYDEGAQMYHMSLSKFQQLAKDAKACYKFNQLVLVNLEILDQGEDFPYLDFLFYSKISNR